jgi:hypothetical protein
MSSWKTRDIRKGLLAKGFNQTKTHHEMYWLYIGDRKTSIRTRISHSESEYGDRLLNQMAKQVGLDRTEFDDLIQCPLSKEQYIELLRSRGIIKFATDQTS